MDTFLGVDVQTFLQDNHTCPELANILYGQIPAFQRRHNPNPNYHHHHPTSPGLQNHLLPFFFDPVDPTYKLSHTYHLPP
jgi:hypothetical protein